MSYDFAKHQHILSTNQENAPLDIGVFVLYEETFDCILEDKIGYEKVRILATSYSGIENRTELIPAS